jgi:ABC-type uncharacterized transport system ATPase subunit
MKLELRGITKRFPGVVANDNVNLSLNTGEVLSLIGENGAGKSTLMSVLYGMYKPDEGEIVIDGTELMFASPALLLELAWSTSISCWFLYLLWQKMWCSALSQLVLLENSILMKRAEWCAKFLISTTSISTPMQ